MPQTTDDPAAGTEYAHRHRYSGGKEPIGAPAPTVDAPGQTAGERVVRTVEGQSRQPADDTRVAAVPCYPADGAIARSYPADDSLAGSDSLRLPAVWPSSSSDSRLAVHLSVQPVGRWSAAARTDAVVARWACLAACPVGPLGPAGQIAARLPSDPAAFPSYSSTRRNFPDAPAPDGTPPIAP